MRIAYQKVNPSGIPASEYTELEFLESSGTQYIDTGYTMKYISASNENVSKTIIEFEANWYETSGQAYQGYGIGSGANVVPYMGPDFVGQSNRRWTIGSTQNYAKSVSSDSEFFGSKHYLKFDGTTATATLDTSSGAVTLNQLSGGSANFLLFAYNSGTLRPNHSRCYSCKIWNNGTLVRNFIPAKRNSDNVLGMYDLCTKSFFTNAGSGTFTAGNVVEKVAKPLIAYTNQTLRFIETGA